MLAAYFNSLLEAVNRRMALVLAGVAVLVAGTFCWIVQLKPLPDGTSVIFLGSNFLGPATLAVPSVFGAEIQQTGALWLLLAIFAAAPLLTSALEKGWIELTLSKSTSRWKIFLGRFLGGVTLYFVTFLLATFPVALRLWWKTGVGPRPLAIALLIQTLSFAALLSIVALATLPQKGMALPAMAAVAVWFFSPSLARRQQSYYSFFTSHFSRGVLDWVYRILPKCSELESMCFAYIHDGKIASWWPFWSTGIFAAAMLGLTFCLLQRKSF